VAVDCFLITCEHGGNRIPAPYRRLFREYRALLDSHRGYDPGALVMARELGRAFGAPLVASTVSRLVIDLNRSLGHPRLFSAATRGAPATLRAEIVQRHYLPYRAEVERVVGQSVARGRRVIHISSHSFTPELDGEVRTADVGLLYDPARRGEAALCARWKASQPQLPLCGQSGRADLAFAPALSAPRLCRDRTGGQPAYRPRRGPTLGNAAQRADRFTAHGMCCLNGPG